jgi:hypothetical protein
MALRVAGERKPIRIRLGFWLETVEGSVNVMAYFAMDNLATVPVPGALWLMASAFAGLAGSARWRARRLALSRPSAGAAATR